MRRDRSSETACCPEHMWRMGPAFSPSRARRAAVSASSGMPSLPQASRVWLTPARRKMDWRVRTWMSSPLCELAMIASSAGSRSNASMPPASMRATTPNGLTVERRVTIRSVSPSWRMSRPRRRPRRCRPDGRSPRCRCGPGARGSARPRASDRHGCSGAWSSMSRARSWLSRGRAYPARRGGASHSPREGPSDGYRAGVSDRASTGP